jgi:hypothetical protein
MLPSATMSVINCQVDLESRPIGSGHVLSHCNQSQQPHAPCHSTNHPRVLSSHSHTHIVQHPAMGIHVESGQTAKPALKVDRLAEETNPGTAISRNSHTCKATHSVCSQSQTSMVLQDKTCSHNEHGQTAESTLKVDRWAQLKITNHPDQSPQSQLQQPVVSSSGYPDSVTQLLMTNRMSQPAR